MIEERVMIKMKILFQTEDISGGSPIHGAVQEQAQLPDPPLVADGAPFYFHFFFTC